MPNRQDMIAKSIQYSIVEREKKLSFFSRLSRFFYIHWLTFECLRADLFQALRETWAINEDDYLTSFGAKDSQRNVLRSMGDMGKRTFDTELMTADSAYLIKSVPRHFEHSFFRRDLLIPYADYMRENPASLLVRITDFLMCAHYSIGSLLGLAPSHQLVMENIMYGQSNNFKGWKNDDAGWESWDLKTMSYFYPERDVAGGVLSSEATKSRLADDFKESIVLDQNQAHDFKLQIEKDTALLRDCNAVDYSLFLVRIPASEAPSPDSQPPLSPDESSSKPIPPAEPPFVPPGPPSWRTGIKSADGHYVYRASILDFFWAKHKVHAKAMTGLIKSYNLFDRQGPMSITTTTPEYRERFLKMCSEIIGIQESVMSAGG